MRERWDSRPSLNRDKIILQAAILGVNVSKTRSRCKGMILCGYIYFSDTHKWFLLRIRILCGAFLRESFAMPATM